MNLFPRRKLLFAKRPKKRRWVWGLLAAALVLVAGVSFVAARTTSWDGALFADSSRPSARGEEPSRTPAEAGQDREAAQANPEDTPAEGPTPEKRPAPDPEQPTPEAAAYVAVAAELPGVRPENLKDVYRSNMDDSWASVRVAPEGEGRDFVVFVRRSGDSWRAEKSIRADEPNYPDNDVVPLAGVPKDLIDYLYTKNVFAAEVPEPRRTEINREDLPSVGPAEFSSTEPVTDGVPEGDRERVEKALGEVRQRIEDYPGVAGVYVRDLKGDYGYGIRPDEQFFSASIIKIPVMVAVYRKVEQGELGFSQQVEIKEEDWAAGAGWLQWEEAGTRQTVGDLLILMMTQSDNVATNALVRRVGGADYVNEVARSLGAKDTLLYQKVSSERGAVPALDNRTTPRDMTAMLQKIADGEAASEKSCGYMIDLMHTNELDWWLDAGLPAGVDAANKAGWLYRVYGDVGIVESQDRRYVVAILSKHGTATVNEGQSLIEDLSRTVWEAQGG
ncbi:MAG: serine hydrolase [Actinomycetota bacterium]|nr:serine hydrolase [Actinomycetota bacterium]